MRSLKGLSIAEIAFLVCTEFDRAGVIVVLSGGAAAAVYAPQALVTRDLDFIHHLGLWAPDGTPLKNLGFAQTKSRGVYSHPDTPYTLEILKGPLGVGDEILNSWKTLKSEDLVLHIISPTDSIRDRLAAAIHFKDLNSAKQAAEIAKLHEVDLEVICKWCEVEGGAKTFKLFKSLLSINE